jgi:hypothetical protein
MPVPRPGRSCGPPRPFRTYWPQTRRTWPIGLPDVKIVAADSHMLAPPVFVGDVPAAAAVLALVP